MVLQKEQFVRNEIPVKSVNKFARRLLSFKTMSRADAFKKVCGF
jgi:hypothetical protein